MISTAIYVVTTAAALFLLRDSRYFGFVPEKFIIGII